MPAGRPPAGPQIVEKLSGDERAKERLQAILETIAGLATIDEASAKLGIRPARFYTMRNEAFSAAVERLEPRRCGRPPKQISPEEARIHELEREVAQLRTALSVAELKVETALVLPRPAAAQRVGSKKAPRSLRRGRSRSRR